MKCKPQTMSGFLERSRLCSWMWPRTSMAQIGRGIWELFLFTNLLATRLQPLQEVDLGQTLWQKLLPQGLQSYRGALEVQAGWRPPWLCAPMAPSASMLSARSLQGHPYSGQWSW